ncbi:MAG: YeeE/YedE family protein [Gammaproteobacteria bacterium]|nr:YeeE/YedE family protein [Gammaproteobacteria bacterium]
MRTIVVALVSGIIFGLGLCVSEMINPIRVIGFLDVLGAWDATLVFVMISAVAVTGIGFPLVIRRAKPVLAGKFVVPERTDIDLRLISGSVLFGIGWGLAGLCPGPAIAALASMSPSILIFVAAMIGGQWLASRFE